MRTTLRFRDELISEPSPPCGNSTSSADFPLRIASIFVILVGASFGALFPVVSRRTAFLRSRIPKGVFDTAKYFGSGVIIATAFIHLLSPAIDELGSPCLSPAWSDYPYALALALISIFLIFVVELVAMRWGTAKLAALGLVHDPHASAHSHPPLCLETPELVRAAVSPGVKDLPYYTTTERQTDGTSVGGISDDITVAEKEKDKDKENGVPKSSPSSVHPHSHDHHHSHSHSHDIEAASSTHVPSTPAMAAAQLVGIAILEFGVLLHSFLIGLTLAVTENFKILFIVLVFHQTFEGLGVGSRLAYLDLSAAGRRWSHVPIWAAIVFGITTPIGIAIGMGIRQTYNPGSATASIVSGVLDAFSAGILIYTGLVELLAHDFLFNPTMIQHASNGELAFAVGSVMLGCGLMALLGRWA
ncbi:Zinc/iron permease [Irpex rosettiformis]|uniref:Zinc/iron permease n=1 Tax=Irpex rosettiformis TaxID=378272 RepID=A0ACB8TNH0_9APHY|nr:Zinc/iron permease [Irpex rosettiformis]